MAVSIKNKDGGVAKKDKGKSKDIYDQALDMRIELMCIVDHVKGLDLKTFNTAKLDALEKLLTKKIRVAKALLENLEEKYREIENKRKTYLNEINKKINGIPELKNLSEMHLSDRGFLSMVSKFVKMKYGVLVKPIEIIDYYKNKSEEVRKLTHFLGMNGGESITNNVESN